MYLQEAIVILLFLMAAVVIFFVRYVPNNRVGIVEKRFSGKGSVESGLIALNGEAGFQPEILRGGLHLLNRLQYRLHTAPLVTIAQGRIGYVFARDGRGLAPAQSLASNAEAKNFEDVREFLAKGGQRGPQRAILREGTYAINLAQFVILTEERLYYLPLDHEDAALFQQHAATIGEREGFSPLVIRGLDDMVGVVTVHDGPALADGEIIAPVVGGNDGTDHNNFQDAERFLALGGRRGRQLQVLVDGTYYVNRLFATIELISKTVIEVGHVGVVVSYTGAHGADLSGVDYKHGELVLTGQRGVWGTPLLPGKYAFNTYAGKVIAVPTTNFILKWIRAQTGAHRYDENLTEVSLITKDAFEPSLPLSVVVHIDYRKAPLVIQRFGDIRKLVEQTLDPMVSAYFKNVGQTRTLIQLLQDRSEIQRIAGVEMREKFAHYNLELEEVLIGTPTSSTGDKRIEDILAQLRQRQIAQEQIETYAQQEKAAVQERELREAEARAKQQTQITESELSITVQSNQGKAEYQRALQQAAQVKTMAEADANRIRTLAEAEAEKAARIGIAQAMAIEEQVRAYGGPQFQLTQEVMSKFAQAIQQSGVDVVPKIVISGGGSGAGGMGAGDTGRPGSGGGQGSLIEALMAMLLSDRLGQMATSQQSSARSSEVERYRDAMKTSLKKPTA